MPPANRGFPTETQNAATANGVPVIDTHFETAGGRQIAGLIATALRETGIPLAAYLR